MNGIAQKCFTQGQTIYQQQYVLSVKENLDGLWTIEPIIENGRQMTVAHRQVSEHEAKRDAHRMAYHLASGSSHECSELCFANWHPDNRNN